MKKTAVIKYNLRERGRKYRGQDRNFDVSAIVRAINSKECQDRVKKRDMLGYYGHWSRIKFGMNPAEGGLDGGKPAIVEPALVTTMLKAYPDGTIEHQAEFLDNDSGRVAAQLYDNRVGGFSSAIDQRRPEFFGFDYVLEPNYSTNRGWTLDSVAEFSEDDVQAAIYGEQIRGVMALLNRAEKEREVANQTIEHLTEENERLLSLCAGGKTLDDTQKTGFNVSIEPKQQILDDINLFRSTKKLPQFAKEDEKKRTLDSARNRNPMYDHILNRLG